MATYNIESNVIMTGNASASSGTINTKILITETTGANGSNLSISCQSKRSGGSVFEYYPDGNLEYSLDGGTTWTILGSFHSAVPDLYCFLNNINQWYTWESSSGNKTWSLSNITTGKIWFRLTGCHRGDHNYSKFYLFHDNTGHSYYSGTNTIEVPLNNGCVWVKTANGWKRAIPYICQNNTWKQCIPYKCENNVWKNAGGN